MESDTFVVVEPQLTLQADGEAFDATIDARGALTRHQDLSRNDSDDYEARAAGRADVTDDLTIAASAAYGRFHEGRESPDDVSALLDVTEFTLSREHLAFEYRPVDWLLRIAGEARQYDFRDTGPVDNDDRDRDEYEVIVRLGRNFLPGLTLFVEPTYNIRRYRNVPDSAGLIRDSDGFDVRAGATYDLTGVTFLELSGGYFRQDFDDPAFGAESGFSVQGRVIWNPTDVLTVTGEVSRAVSESTLATVSGVVGTAVGVGLDYEIRDFLLLSGRAAYLNSDFGSSGRNDDTYRGSLALIGLVNDYMSLTARYEYAERLSNALGEDFRSNTFLLSLDLQF